MKTIFIILAMVTGLSSCSDNDENNTETIFTLSYDINGAENGTAPEPVIYEAGSVITLDSGNDLSRTGFTFGGWNTNPNGSGTDYAAGSNYILTGSIILYAKWNPVVDINNMRITIGSTTFNAALASNQTATTFKALLPMTINMSELNNNEKYYGLPQSLPANASSPVNINNGDIMLYGSSTLVLFYKTFSTSYSYTRIGTVDNPAGLQEAVGSGSITVTFEIGE